MKKSIRNKIFATTACLAISAACVGAGMLTLAPEKVSADVFAETDFAMQTGALIRVDGGTGIRFVFDVTKAGWTELTKAYSPETYTYKLYTEIDKTDNSDTGEEVTIVQDAFTFGEEETGKTFYATILFDEVTEANLQKAYALSLTANTYIDVLQGETVVETFEAANNGQSRSIREAAYIAMEQGVTGEAVEKLRGTVTEESVSFSAWDEAVEMEIDATTVSAVYLNEEAVEDFTLESGKLSIAVSFFENAYEDQTVTVISEAGITKCTLTSENDFYLTQENAHRLRELGQSGSFRKDAFNVYMTDDIDFSEITWAKSFATNNRTFYRLNFDGQNHEITGLSSTAYSNNSALGTGLFDCFIGTFKNVAIVDYTSNQVAGGVIADECYDMTLENVFISVGTTASNNYFGVIGRYGVNSKTFTLNNVYISIPTANKSNGLLFGYGATKAYTVNLTACTFVGGYEDGQLVSSRDGYTYTVSAASTYTRYADILSAAPVFAGKTDFISATFNKYSNIITIGNNADDVYKLLTATEGYLLLTEDISLATYNGYGSVVLLDAFNGTLDGAGHTITVPAQRAASGNYASLWRKLNGTLKNVALNIAKLRNNGGGVAWTAGTMATFNNVYVNIQALEGTTHGNWVAGGLLRSGHFVNMSMNNVIVNMPTACASVGLISGFCGNGSMDFTNLNCYFIGGDGTISGNTLNGTSVKDGDSYAKNVSGFIYTDTTVEETTTSAYDNFLAAYRADSVTLTDYQKAWLGLTA